MSPLLPNHRAMHDDLISFKHIKEEEHFSDDSVSDKESEEEKISVSSDDFAYFNEVSIDQLSSGTPRFEDTLSQISECPMGTHIPTEEACKIEDLKDINNFVRYFKLSREYK